MTNHFTTPDKDHIKQAYSLIPEQTLRFRKLGGKEHQGALENALKTFYENLATSEKIINHEIINITNIAPELSGSFHDLSEFYASPTKIALHQQRDVLLDKLEQLEEIVSQELLPHLQRLSHLIWHFSDSKEQILDMNISEKAVLESSNALKDTREKLRFAISGMDKRFIDAMESKEYIQRSQEIAELKTEAEEWEEIHANESERLQKIQEKIIGTRLHFRRSLFDSATKQGPMPSTTPITDEKVNIPSSAPEIAPQKSALLSLDDVLGLGATLSQELKAVVPTNQQPLKSTRTTSSQAISHLESYMSRQGGNDAIVEAILDPNFLSNTNNIAAFLKTLRTLDPDRFEMINELNKEMQKQLSKFRRDNPKDPNILTTITLSPNGKVQVTKSVQGTKLAEYDRSKAIARDLGYAMQLGWTPQEMDLYFSLKYTKGLTYLSTKNFNTIFIAFEQATADGQLFTIEHIIEYIELRAYYATVLLDQAPLFSLDTGIRIFALLNFDIKWMDDIVQTITDRAAGTRDIWYRVETGLREARRNGITITNVIDAIISGYADTDPYGNDYYIGNSSFTDYGAAYKAPTSSTIQKEEEKNNEMEDEEAAEIHFEQDNYQADIFKTTDFDIPVFEAKEDTESETDEYEIDENNETDESEPVY